MFVTSPGTGSVTPCARWRWCAHSGVAGCLVEGIQRYLTHAFISNDDLYAGNWQPGLDAIFSQPRREIDVATNGAEVAAEILDGYLR